MEKKRNLKQYLQVGCAGFAMGVANVIPGVSGGTMAFILGVFEELIDSIRQVASASTIRKLLHLQFRALFRDLPWRFLLVLFLGVGLALVSAASLFTFLLAEYAQFTYAFFFGLIIASVATMLREVTRWNVASVASLIVGTAFAGWLVSMVPATTDNVWYISLACGAIVICAMILPGISGSFLLLLFGQYNYVWGAVASIRKFKLTLAEFSTLFWTAVGAVAGLALFVHLLDFLLKKWRNSTMAALIGFMIGSLWRLWPWQETVRWAMKTDSGKVSISSLEYLAYKNSGAKLEQLEVRNVLPESFDGKFFLTVALIVVGAALVVAVEHVARRKVAEK